MRNHKFGLLLVAAAGIMAGGCKDPELAGEPIKTETGLLRVVNLTQNELQVKFGSQLNTRSVAALTGTMWQKQKAGSVSVVALNSMNEDLGGKAEVPKGQLATYVILQNDGKSASQFFAEEPAKEGGSSIIVRVVYAAAREGSTLKASLQGGSSVEVSAGKTAELTLDKAGASRLVFESGSGQKLESDADFEPGGSYTFFVSDGTGKALVGAYVRNDQKLTAVGESGSS